jgi:hypothetical protein
VRLSLKRARGHFCQFIFPPKNPAKVCATVLREQRMLSAVYTKVESKTGITKMLP